MRQMEGEIVSTGSNFIWGDFGGGSLDVGESDADFAEGWLGQVLGPAFHLCQGIEEEVSLPWHTGVLSLWRRRYSDP